MNTKYVDVIDNRKVSYEDSEDGDLNKQNPVLICIPGIGDLRSEVFIGCTPFYQ